ncbi:GNAT family N-acetyltransferase [Mesobacillus maritimus]|uniref:GNAT family N-acetyltransferase n=1 Tax=Mesobacillus maritimus TaxID=1643336 RepID=UPI0038501088
MSFVIRKMIKEDIKQVQYVAKRSWNDTYEGIIPFDIQENFLEYAYNDEMLKKRLEGSFLFVAVVENTIVGFANFSPVKKEGEVELGAIYLHPNHQGKGIGSALLQEGIVNVEGVRKVYINVEKENEIGKTFYEAKGFETVEEFDDEFDGHILKTVRMVLKV